MINELRQLCVQRADALIKDVDWRKCDRNLLFNKYVEYENVDKDVAGAYISAILIRYWYTIKHNMLRGAGKCTAEDCYNWMVDALLYTLEHKAWLDPTKTVYQDPNGPSKCFVIKLECTRKVFYLYSNSQKRKQDYSGVNTSLELLREKCGDCEMASEEHLKYDSVTSIVDTIIKEEFKSQNYMSAFIIDGVANASVLDCYEEENGIYTQFSRRRLNSYLNNLDYSYCKTFATKYRVDTKEVEDALTYCKTLSRTKIQRLIDITFDKLRSDVRLVDKKC